MNLFGQPMLQSRWILWGYIAMLFLVGLWPMNFFLKNGATLDDKTGLIIAPPSAVFTTILPQNLHNLREFTIFMDVSSRFSGSKGFGNIFAYASEYEHINFMVGQWKNGIVLRIRQAKNPVLIHFGKKNVFYDEKPSRFAFVYDGNTLTLYHNGRKSAHRRTGVMNFSKWERSYPLVIGSDASGRSPWRGTIRTIAIFPKALPEHTVRGLPAGIAELSPLIYYPFKKNGRQNSEEQSMGTQAYLRIPPDFTPYRRAFLNFSFTELKRFPRDLTDIIINILGFIPLGFLLALQMFRKDASAKRFFFIAVFIGFSISFAIETSQAFIFDRSSSLIDLCNNTLGSAVGVLAAHLQ